MDKEIVIRWYCLIIFIRIISNGRLACFEETHSISRESVNPLRRLYVFEKRLIDWYMDSLLSLVSFLKYGLVSNII